jgi:hypothetical protein
MGNGDCTSNNCSGNVCLCATDSDCTTNACDVNTHMCVASQCTDGQKDGNETDVDCGGGTCPACLAGDHCAVNSDCTSNLCLGGICYCLRDADCATNACDALSDTCVSNQCADNRQDGNETDIDCGGGGACPACPYGDKCLVDGDCTTGACSGVDGGIGVCQCTMDGQCPMGQSCTAGTCTCSMDSQCATNACDANTNLCVSSQCVDHHKDGAETDVDCGGGTCPACPTGDGCAVNTDCTSGFCAATSHLCVATQCEDQVKDGSETDVDCGGGTCPKCPTGDACKVNSDCTNGFCHTNHTCN